MIRIYQLKNMTGYLCKLTGVSRSGYYNWLQSSEKKAICEEEDYQDYLLLKSVYNKAKGKIGYQGLYMALLNILDRPINHKKILRLMRKYNFFAKIRRENPYRKIAKAKEVHRAVPNYLNRKFKQDEPGKVLLTDITYLQYYGGQTAYLSCVKDVATREIVTYELSRSLSMNIVYKTLEKLGKEMNGNIHPEAMIHSDQGVHYTHPEYQKRVKELGLLQSMSRRGNCLDNAPIESFFGHLKDEVNDKEERSIEGLKYMIEKYIDYYNKTRKQWNLKKMTPEAYRSHLIAA